MSITIQIKLPVCKILKNGSGGKKINNAQISNWYKAD